MRSRVPCSLVGILALASATGVVAATPPARSLAASPITAPLVASASNPNYFQDAAGGGPGWA